VLAVEGNRIRLSRKAILKEQRAKMGGGEAPPDHAEGGDEHAAPVEASNHGGTLTIEGGADFDDNEPNFNREGAAVAPAGDRPQGERHDRGPGRGGDRGGRGGGRGGRPGGGGGRGRGRGGPGGRGGRPGGGGGRH